MLIVTSEQMRDIENAALDYDITLPRLMENAGSAAAAFIRRLFPVSSLNCVVFCGNGNNGGDGFVVARRLSEHGAKVVVVLVNGAPATEQARQMFDALKTFEIPILTVEDHRALVESYSKHADLLVDGIYGTGFRDSRLPTFALIACQIMNEAPAAIVSLDIPSGITCNRGVIAFGGVKADFTVVFQILKPLHILPASMEACGDIQVVEIGLPEEIFENINSYFSFIDEDKVWKSLPERKEDSHKGDYGHLLVICGSDQYPGAGILPTEAAMRTGIGLCTVIAPESICSNVINRIPEAIVQPIPNNNSELVKTNSIIPVLSSNIHKATAVLFGCGVGVNEQSFQALEYLLKNISVPLILDADALTMLAEHLDLLQNASCPVILTPHPSEMATLSGATTAFIQSNRVTSALDFVDKHDVTLVLKGKGTLIAQRDGKLFINETGGHGLSKGGSGDILAGIIAGFIAQDMSATDGCTAGVWIHGAAGDRCAKRLSSRWMLPSDILSDMSDMFREHEVRLDEVSEG